ncbi:hypothetical protein EIN_282580 [Entamoeba invadens IP1]|uniref:Secreted protein n=1 Tax=Entamoeba invadens IP1 TaxID=370355 RepID=A0A0A1TX78_ENTIV|nr:hypothetical protein EIN_282580 [Entamoeba invadens IP1]ELP85867.1 hypothetical protein EIN_282580 [Entamoeba invadens IP1]|eukprot:XP_004185213.1 hypothetical protein EIN_282580 [Entamoeba invadens IP1]
MTDIILILGFVNLVTRFVSRAGVLLRSVCLVNHGLTFQIRLVSLVMQIVRHLGVTRLWDARIVNQDTSQRTLNVANAVKSQIVLLAAKLNKSVQLVHLKFHMSIQMGCAYLATGHDELVTMMEHVTGVLRIMYHIRSTMDHVRLVLLLTPIVIHVTLINLEYAHNV